MQGLAGEAYGSYSNSKGQIFDNIIDYNGKFADHNINATLLVGIEKRDGYSFRAYGTDFQNMILSYYALGTAGNQTLSSSGYQEQYAYQMGRASYNYKSKYFFTGTIRRFLAFAKNKKINLFPFCGVAGLCPNKIFEIRDNLIEQALGG